MHAIEVKVYYEDTDTGGVVYYANYLRYFERARTEHLEAGGISLPEYQNKGYIFAVARAEAAYKAPAVYGDILTVETTVSSVKGASFTVEYRIKRKKDDRLLVTGSTRMACVNKDMRPVTIPAEIKDVLLKG